MKHRYKSQLRTTFCNTWGGGCRHSSVDSSEPSILPPQARVPSTPSRYAFINLYLNCVMWKRRKINWKRGQDWPIKNCNAFSREETFVHFTRLVRDQNVRLNCVSFFERKFENNFSQSAIVASSRGRFRFLQFSLSPSLTDLSRAK